MKFYVDYESDTIVVEKDDKFYPFSISTRTHFYGSLNNFMRGCLNKDLSMFFFAVRSERFEKYLSSSFKEVRLGEDV